MSSVRIPTLTIASVLAAAALWSCNKTDAPESEQTGSQAQEQPSSPMPAAGGDMMQQLRAGCPMVVEGSDVEVADTEKGVALTFTTEASEAGDLRVRVQHMADDNPLRIETAAEARNFPYVEDALGPEGTLVGLDYSQEMLDAARGAVARHRWSNIRLVHGDASSLHGPRNGRARHDGSTHHR